MTAPSLWSSLFSSLKVLRIKSTSLAQEEQRLIWDVIFFLSLLDALALRYLRITSGVGHLFLERRRGVAI